MVQPWRAKHPTIGPETVAKATSGWSSPPQGLYGTGLSCIISSLCVSSHIGPLAREASELCYLHQGRFSQDFQLRTGSTGAYRPKLRKTNG